LQEQALLFTQPAPHRTVEIAAACRLFVNGINFNPGSGSGP